MMRRIALVALAAALALLSAFAWGSPRTAAAGPFVVDSTADAVDATPGDGICADAGGGCTLLTSRMMRSTESKA